MPKTYFTSDHHFFHKNVIRYCDRPFAPQHEKDSGEISHASVTRMTEEMIRLWNEVVKPEDTVYYLGDFSLSMNAMVLVQHLNGHKILIPGNHDHCFPFGKKDSLSLANKRKRYYDAGFELIINEPLKLEVAGQTFLCWHLPYLSETEAKMEHKPIKYHEYRPKDQGGLMLHGHVHEKWLKNGRMINVGVDVWDFKPVSEEDILEALNDPRPFIKNVHELRTPKPTT